MFIAAYRRDRRVRAGSVCCHRHTEEEGETVLSHWKAYTEWKLERSIREQALLKAQLTQLKESLKQAQLERDEYAQHLEGERARWQQRMRKMSQEVRTLKEERQQDMCRVEELERRLSTLKNQMAEPLPPEPPAVPPEEELQHLRKELEQVSAELQAQVENHQHVSLLNQAQKERLREQEEKLREQQERLREQEEKLREQEEKLQEQQEKLQEQQERLRKQEERLQQLAEPQSGIEELNNENKSALQVEQQVEELQEKLGEEHLEAASQQNQQLQDQLNLMVLPGEGDGGGHLDSEEEEGPRPMPSVPEDMESWEAMVPFFNSAGASAQEEQAQLREQETEQRVCCQRLAHTVPSAEEELEAAVPAPGTGGESVIGETQRGLWEVMEKLESGLMDLLEEQTDLRERVEKLQVQFIQYWRERCHQKIRHLINEPGGNVKDAARGGHHQAGPGLGGDEGKAAAASGDAVGACSDYSEGHSKLLASSQNPADEPGPGAPVPQELGAAHKHGDIHEMSLTNSEEPAQGEDTEGSPHNNPTAQPIVQEHQENQEHPGFGSKRPVPFFCWAWLLRRR
ncbi:putative golgin subfamily A member 8D [Trachypithecus francoisi]|uniref:putative golgin subfamily A member 8D n=1 Tax=Trachypithecus francoisi TaxID=54180 RepID=UPI00141B6C9F|nr:putative golgin subfamily A member 8D [Trachypithecus francoisi]